MSSWKCVDNVWEQRLRELSSFMKDEVYSEYKYNRGINSRSDGFKCIVGPIFKLIEEVVYQNKHFIKHIPVAERASYIKQRLGAYQVRLSTDHTAYEASFVKKRMEVSEFVVYQYMTQFLPDATWWMPLVKEVLAGKNWCKFRDFFVELEATRMSGEMCTSLGNGVDNCLSMLFVCEKAGCTDVDGVVEGDDGDFGVNGTPPGKQDFERLGLMIKLETHVEPSTMSFCGIVFHEDDCINVTDPREVLATFGWASARYARSGRKTLDTLLRCKAVSYAHQYPGCPIIQALAQYGLRLTRHVTRARMFRLMNSRKAMNMWERDLLLQAIKDEYKIHVVDPPIKTRLLVERLYGIRVEHQMLFEKHMANKDDLFPISFELFDMYMPGQWSHYWTRYVGDTSGDPNRPVLEACRQYSTKLPCVVRKGWLVSPDAPPPRYKAPRCHTTVDLSLYL